MRVGWFCLGLAGKAQPKWFRLTCLSSSSWNIRLTWTCSSRTGRALESKPSCTRTFQDPPPNIQLTKVSHMGNPKSKCREDSSARGGGEWGQVFLSNDESLCVITRGWLCSDFHLFPTYRTTLTLVSGFSSSHSGTEPRRSPLPDSEPQFPHL